MGAKKNILYFSHRALCPVDAGRIGQHEHPRGQRRGHWFGFGLLAGAALLSKYTNAVFFVGLGLYLVATRKGREELRRPGVYIAALVALAVFAPHLWWLG